MVVNKKTNMDKKYIFVGVGVVAVLLVLLVSSKGGAPLGGYLTSSVTATNASVNSTSTAVIAAGSKYARIVVQNGVVAGGADAYCAFGAAATTSKGLYISFATSSPNSYRDITDPNLVGKAMNCVGSTTLSILAY
jgi:hypothetical protein